MENSIKRKNEIKKLPLLYILFCMLLKIDPLQAKIDFGKARVKLTKEMRIEVKYMNELSRQAVLRQQEYNQAMEKEQELQKQNELRQSKKKLRKYLK